MIRDCPTPGDFQRPTAARPQFDTQANFDGFRAKQEQLCYLCNKPGHFAANCPKAGATADDKAVQLDSLRTPARDKPVLQATIPRGDRKQLVTALAAELGVIELGLVIPEFRHPPRPMPEENSNSSSLESLDSIRNCSARISIPIFEKSNSTPNSEGNSNVFSLSSNLENQNNFSLKGFNLDSNHISAPPDHGPDPLSKPRALGPNRISQVVDLKTGSQNHCSPMP